MILLQIIQISLKIELLKHKGINEILIITHNKIYNQIDK